MSQTARLSVGARAVIGSSRGFLRTPWLRPPHWLLVRLDRHFKDPAGKIKEASEAGGENEARQVASDPAIT